MIKGLFLLFSLFASHMLWAKTTCLQTYSLSPHIHVSRVNLSCKNIQLIASTQNDQGLSVSEFAEKYQTNIAINGSFFRQDLSPIGLNISQFKRTNKSYDTRARSFLACTAQNQCYIDPKNSVTKINPKWQFAVAGWQYYHQQSGKFECAISDSIGCQQGIFTGKHPRTMVGLDNKRQWLYLVVVEGRQLNYRGMTMDELAELATQIGLTQAVNLDGGGSSTMVVNQQRVSRLPLLQMRERKVGNHFGVKLLP
ncbi:MAG: phosphodiester glycosidase family protein [Pasteurellaceae bacterium]|nr:phosphodiester glycosidase family protein [Pasteurellaceae bacterium]